MEAVEIEPAVNETLSSIIVVNAPVETHPFYKLVFNCNLFAAKPVLNGI
jgi:hypothetical protein